MPDSYPRKNKEKEKNDSRKDEPKGGMMYMGNRFDDRCVSSLLDS